MIGQVFLLLMSLKILLLMCSLLLVLMNKLSVVSGLVLDHSFTTLLMSIRDRLVCVFFVIIVMKSFQEWLILISISLPIWRNLLIPSP